MSQQIRDSIHARLVASQSPGTVYDAVGGRIYESAAPQAAVMPHLVYSVEADPQETFFGGARTEVAEVVFMIRGPKGNQTGQQPYGGSPGAQSVGAIEGLLHALMHGASLTCSGRDRCLMQCRSRGVPSIDDDGHMVSSIYTATATAT